MAIMAQDSASGYGFGVPDAGGAQPTAASQCPCRYSASALQHSKYGREFESPWPRVTAVSANSAGTFRAASGRGRIRQSLAMRSAVYGSVVEANRLVILPQSSS